jgi:hypothetical protein
MKRYRAIPEYGQSAQAFAMQGLSTSQQLATMQNQGPSVRFVEDASGAWVAWKDAQTRIQELENEIMALRARAAPPSPDEKLSECECSPADLWECGAPGCPAKKD